MPLITCSECENQISDKARSCPKCGHPLNGIFTPLAKNAQSSIDAINKRFAAPITSVNINELMQDVTPLPKSFSAGRSFNGVGTSIGGFVSIPGHPKLGIVRKYVCFLFIPVIPLGLYLVKDWHGSGGSFIGEIDSEKAEKYINMKKQSLATIFWALCMAGFFIGVITIFSKLKGY
jgi:hypothetical protein